jgi:hypothetical protein
MRPPKNPAAHARFVRIDSLTPIIGFFLSRQSGAESMSAASAAD